MFTLTNNAREHICRILADYDGRVVLRISRGPEGLQIVTGRVLIGDTTFTALGRTILAVDQMTMQSLGGHMLDTAVVDGQTVLELVKRETI